MFRYMILTDLNRSFSFFISLNEFYYVWVVMEKSLNKSFFREYEYEIFFSLFLLQYNTSHYLFLSKRYSNVWGLHLTT